MNILIFHPSLLPPKNYGGIERVVLWLAKGLVEFGHQVTIGAYPGSQLPPGVELLPFSKDQSSSLHLLERLPKKLDIVHFMAPPEPDVWQRLPCPAFLTVHGNGKAGEKYPKGSVFLSKNHAERNGSKNFVYNGVDPTEYFFDPTIKSDSYLFLSKTSWKVKNLSGALKMCAKAKVPLRVAGGNRPLSLKLKSYFQPRVTWIGPVATHKKAKLLAQSKALVFPVLWPEPFGLVVIESLISGTPVIASDWGSMKELIVDPKIGRALPINPETEDTWIELLASKDQGFDSEACRNYALKKFHYHRMVEDYMKYYTGANPEKSEEKL